MYMNHINCNIRTIFKWNYDVNKLNIYWFQSILRIFLEKRAFTDRQSKFIKTFNLVGKCEKKITRNGFPKIFKIFKTCTTKWSIYYARCHLHRNWRVWCKDQVIPKNSKQIFFFSLCIIHTQKNVLLN